jgi:hypothetical protein
VVTARSSSSPNRASYESEAWWRWVEPPSDGSMYPKRLMHGCPYADGGGFTGPKLGLSPSSHTARAGIWPEPFHVDPYDIHVIWTLLFAPRSCVTRP